MEIENGTTEANLAKVTTEAVTIANARNVTNTDVFRTLGIMIGIFDIILGSCGNLLTIIVILKNKKFHKPFYMFIANLCVIDFLTASAMMPFNVTSYYLERWPFGNDPITCSIMAFCYYCCGYSSIVCLLTITVNRFVGVVYPEKYPDLFTKRRIICIVITCWVFAPSFLAPIFSFTNNGYGWNSHQTLCVFNTKAFKPEEHSYMQFIRILFQFLPLVIMILLYVLIFKKSRQCRHAVTKISSKNSSTYDVTKERQTHSSSSIFAKIANHSQSLKSINMNSIKGLDFLADLQAAECDTKLNLNIDGSNTLVKDSKLEIKNTKPSRKLSQDNLECLIASDVNNGTASTDQENKRSSEGLYVASKASPRLKHRFEAIRSSSAPCSPSINGRRELNSPSRTKITRQGLITYSTSYLNSNYTSRRHTNEGKMHSWSSINQVTNQLRKKPRKYSSAMQLEARKRKLVDRRLLRISVTICSAFMILFLPSVIINLLKISDPRVHMCASFVTWFNSCVNPIIYCFMNDKMRYQYKMMVVKVWNIISPCTKFKEIPHVTRRMSKNSTSTLRKSSFV